QGAPPARDRLVLAGATFFLPAEGGIREFHVTGVQTCALPILGTRMRSRLAKVLHPVAGRPMLEHVIQAVQAAGISRTVVVVGHQADRVRAERSEEHTSE